MNLRETILGAKDRNCEAVTVPEWKDEDGKPVTVWVYQMSLKQRMSWLDSIPEDKGDHSYFARLLVQTVCDESGHPIFTADDIDALMDRNEEPVARLYLAAKRLNGFGQQAVEDAEKNS